MRILIKKILIKMIRGYQLYISPMTGPHCKYTPTCSEYAIQALKKYGAVKGMLVGSPVHFVLNLVEEQNRAFSMGSHITDMQWTE